MMTAQRYSRTRNYQILLNNLPKTALSCQKRSLSSNWSLQLIEASARRAWSQTHTCSTANLCHSDKVWIDPHWRLLWVEGLAHGDYSRPGPCRNPSAIECFRHTFSLFGRVLQSSMINDFPTCLAPLTRRHLASFSVRRCSFHCRRWSYIFLLSTKIPPTIVLRV